MLFTRMKFEANEHISVEIKCRLCGMYFFHRFFKWNRDEAEWVPGLRLRRDAYEREKEKVKEKESDREKLSEEEGARMRISEKQERCQREERGKRALMSDTLTLFF